MNELTDTKKQEFQEKGTDIVSKAKSMMILSPALYQNAIKGVDIAKGFQVEVSKVWDPVCDAANKAHKAATKGRKDQVAPFIEAEQILKRKLNEYDLEQERIAREEAQRKAKEEADRKLLEAETLEEEDKTEEADELIETAAIEEKAANTVHVESGTPEGIRYQDNWKFIIDHPHMIPRDYCVPDQSKLDATAKASKGSATLTGGHCVNNRIPIRRKS